ncbi:CLUMA_CG017305, isoform A, partial [Clunio marinus]
LLNLLIAHNSTIVCVYNLRYCLSKYNEITSFKLELSQLFKMQSKSIVLGVSIVTAGICGWFAYKYIRKRIRNTPPKKSVPIKIQSKMTHRELISKYCSRWRKVGELTDMMCYPIKSCGFIRREEFDCTTIGFQFENIRDRIFMIVNADGEFVTARTYPKLWQVTPDIDGDIMILSAPGMINLTVDVARLLKIKPIKAQVWGETVSAVDAGEESARWFSRFIFQEDFGLRLVFYPLSIPSRKVRAKNKIFDTAIKSDTGAYHDATSFMLINESSIADLNSRLKSPVSKLQFRPNFVMKGAPAFEEDKWRWIRIGDVIFQNVKPCTRHENEFMFSKRKFRKDFLTYLRCLFINIDPETAERNPDQEPLKTLQSYRTFPKTGSSPVMGIHLGLRGEGKVNIGDSIYVEELKFDT